jgi:hypothetical protein
MELITLWTDRPVAAIKKVPLFYFDSRYSFGTIKMTSNAAGRTHRPDDVRTDGPLKSQPEAGESFNRAMADRESNGPHSSRALSYGGHRAGRGRGRGLEI